MSMFVDRYPHIGTPECEPVWWVVVPKDWICQILVNLGVVPSTCYVLTKAWIEAVSVGAVEIGLQPDQVVVFKEMERPWFGK